MARTEATTLRARRLGRVIRELETQEDFLPGQAMSVGLWGFRAR